MRAVGVGWGFPPNMKREAVIGAVWTLVERVGAQALSFAAFVILARLLHPESYGLVTLAASIVAVPSIFLNEGFNATLIQRESLDDDHVNAAFWANLGLSLIFVAAVFGASDWASEIARAPAMAPILRLVSLTMVPAAVGSVMAALFLRRLEYGTIALRTLVAQTSCALVAIVMAALGFGVWALVAQMLVFTVIGAAVLWRGACWRPRLSLSTKAFRDIFHFSARTMLSNFLRFAHERADTLIIGVFLSPAALGLYFLTQRLLATIEYVTVSPVVNVMMPVLSRMQGERERLGHTYVRMLSIGASLWVPTVVGIGAVSGHLFPLLFGDKWDGAQTVMSVMSVTAVSLCMTRPTREILLSMNRPGVYACLNAAQLVLLIALMLVGVRFGLAAAATAYVLASVLAVPLHLYALSRYTSVSPCAVLARLLPVFGAGAVMAAAVYGAGIWASWGSWTLLPQIAIGIVTYPACLYLFAPAQIAEAAHAIYQSLPQRLRFLHLSP